MARIRTVKPSFFVSTTIADLPLTARLTFIGLWTHADDKGRAVDDPRIIKGALWALDDKHTSKRVDLDLTVLEKHGFIERYAVDGRRYLRVRNWSKHQKINRPVKSMLPASPEEDGAPQEDEDSPTTHGGLTEDSMSEQCGLTEDSMTERKGREGNRERKGTTDSVSHNFKGEPLTGVVETEPEFQRRSSLCARVVGSLDSGIKPPPATQVLSLVNWALSHLDWLVVEEAVAYAGTLDQRPRSLKYLAKMLRQWGAERSVEMPEWAP